MKLSLEQQKKLFQLHLQSQQKSRESKQQLKKLVELEKKNPQEHMLYIQKQFKIKAESVSNAIKKYKEKQIPFEQLMKQYALAKQYYVNVSYALKTYDRQSYKQSLDKMYTTLIDLKKNYEPKKKFKFSRRQQDFGVKAQVTQQLNITKQTNYDNIQGISNKTNQTITVSQTDIKIGSYKIVNCTSSLITLLHKTQILFLKNLTSCTIKAALVKSTVFVDNCTDCTLQINCHQLRIHNTYNTTLKIFVTSKAIIEDCNKVIFTPYTFQYEGKQKDQEEFQRKGKENLWRDIQDFNWLKQGQKSPHYQLKEI